MANKRAFDPKTTFCFRVILAIDGHSSGETFFKSVSGLKYETEVVDYKQGGENLTTRRLVGATKWAPIVLKKGFCGDSKDLIQWKRAWMDNSGKALKRANGKIIQLNSDLSEVCSWEFFRGWPTKWELSEHDASKAEIAIETLEIAHEGLIYTPGK